MKLVLNGREIETGDEITIAELLRDREIDPATVVVERNREVLGAAALETNRLREGDELEVVRFVGGG
ncbi:MAG: thiamine biosynthesis protein ThiS [Gemmatimonadetes bacterium]|nr:thiamine biosynthesis protein ThiS [Gemmatimonadota bacterium]